MRPFVVSIVAIALVAVSSLSTPRHSTALAQETTTETPTPSGVVFEPITGELVPPVVAEGAEVRLERAKFSPDAAFSVPADDAELLLVTVESGSLTVESSAPLVINRAGEGTTATGTREWIAANTSLTLERGDSFVRPPGSGQELHNRGSGPATALMASIASQSTGSSKSESTTPGGGLVIALAVVVVPECEEGYEPVEVAPAATPGGGGGGGGAGGVAVAIAAAPECVGVANAGPEPLSASTPVP